MARLFRLTHSYSLCGGLERAAHTLHVLGGNTDTAALLAGFIGPAFDTYWGSVKTEYTASTSPLRLRVDEVDVVTGRTISGQDATITITPGTGAGSAMPPQCAIVVTLRTALSGPRFRGRMYLPATRGLSLAANGTLNLTQRDIIAGNMVTYLNGIFLHAGTTFQSVVFSRAAGGSSPVRTIEVGDVLDTQRSRRDSLIEQRTSRALLP